MLPLIWLEDIDEEILWLESKAECLNGEDVFWLIYDVPDIGWLLGGFPAAEEADGKENSFFFSTGLCSGDIVMASLSLKLGR